MISMAYDLAHTQDGNDRCSECFKILTQNIFRSIDKLKEIKVFTIEQSSLGLPSYILELEVPS